MWLKWYCGCLIAHDPGFHPQHCRERERERIQEGMGRGESMGEEREQRKMRYRTA
jgi:hypothetical protein